MTLDAYLLVIHGSRDARPHTELARLAQHVAQRLSQVKQPLQDAIHPQDNRTNSTLTAIAPFVGTAALELTEAPLHQQILDFAHHAQSQGYHQINLVPLFLLPGVHVMQDIPNQVAIAQQSLPSTLSLHICPHLGRHPGMVNLLRRSLADPTTGKILIAHGSRRVGGNQPIEAIAHQLAALPAYWAVPPDLDTQLEQLIAAGHRQIDILPYFLFPGTITDAIAQHVDELAHQYPDRCLSLKSPLGVSDRLVDLVLAVSQTQNDASF